MLLKGQCQFLFVCFKKISFFLCNQIVGQWKSSTNLLQQQQQQQSSGASEV